MPSIKKLLQAAAGNAGESLYVEDVFSTYLYEGTGTAQTITNGIDLDGEGGMVWIKTRNVSSSNVLYDTERGVQKAISSNLTLAEDNDVNSITSFNSNGFTDNGSNSLSGRDYASWTFRKAEKFFDVVTWVGSNDSGTDIGKGIVAHNLGVAPAVVIVKNATQSSTNWIVYHKNQTTGYYSILNSTAAQTNSGSVSYFSKYIDGVGWQQTDPDADNIYVGYNYQTNGNTDTIVAYLFASDAGGFGDDGSESIIKCGSYTGNGSTDGPVVDVGFEPQWLMVKHSDGVDNWYIINNMTGMVVGGADNYLFANTNNAELTGAVALNPLATGFQPIGGNINSSGTYIYIAIRRPMKTPESGTEVFTPVAQTNGGSRPYPVTAGFSVDSAWFGQRNGWGVNFITSDRLRGATNLLLTTSTNSEATNNSTYGPSSSRLDSNTQFFEGMTNVSEPDIYWMFKRATGFFDVVCLNSTTSVAQVLSHNLGVAPELIISKGRNVAAPWQTMDATNYLRLNTDQADLGVPVYHTFTSTTFSIDSGACSSGENWVFYLFATLAGVSKVGSYTGTGADLNVDCGFSAGARFILIKRTDSTGDWYVYDSARGIVAGNDPYLLLNSTAAEVTGTDYIDPLSSGFTVTSSAPAALNASGGTYIFLAIA
jgi:hypothetical protein